ncbi:MAG: AMP-binding protein [Pseudomonadota bacterium]
MNLFAQFTQHYHARREHVMFEEDDGRRWTYDDVMRISNRLLVALDDCGLKHGDRLLVQTGKSVEVVVLYLTCLRAGIVFVPLNTAYQREELTYFINDADPALIVVDSPDVLTTSNRPVRTLMGDTNSLLGTKRPRGDVDWVTAENEEPLSAASVADKSIDATTAAVIIYTSGTTGRSKGAVLSHGNLFHNASALVESWGFSTRDTLLHILPVFHVHGLLIALNTAFLSGASVRFCGRFEPESVCRLLPACSVLMGVPTHYTRLLDVSAFGPACLPSIRVFISGSAPLQPETFARFEARTGHRILERYGMSETNILCSNPLAGERIAGTVGYALRDTEIRIADDEDVALDSDQSGHVQVRGQGVFKGYWRRPELNAREFTPDGFFRTGDLGALDESGRLRLVGRAKDLIISGGLNVYPAELEQFLDAQPGVVESAVIGVADADFGERVEAFVVVDTTGPASVGKLAEACRDGLANFKRPKAFHLIESLPRNTMGKVQKTMLRARRQ